MDEDTYSLFISQFNRGLDVIIIFIILYLLLHWTWLMAGILVGGFIALLCFIFYLHNRYLYKK